MPPINRRVPHRWLRGALLHGVSVLAVTTVLGNGVARAQTVSALVSAARQGASASSGLPSIVAPKVTIGSATTTMGAASVRTLTSQARASQAVSLAQQAQAAAQAAAAALASTVPDGLAVGGLQTAGPTLAAASDPTGVLTWQGASAPTQSTSGTQTTVTVAQTDPRAILSWTTFNVGRNTTLVFDQKQNGTAQPSWVVLNRVVGQIDPATGLRDPGQAPAPSQILGQIKADGEVLVLNPNGVIFGATSQVNTHALVATSLDIGQSLVGTTPLTIQERDQTFLTYGILGPQEALGAGFTFSAEALSTTQDDPILEGPVAIDAGARITSDPTGFLLFLAPKVGNWGVLTSPQGQVSLQSGRYFTLQPSDGSATSIDPNVRGLVITSLNKGGVSGDFVSNASTGEINVADGYVSLGATGVGAVFDDGIVQSSTSVSRNGFVRLSAPDIELSGVISITPDDSAGSLPQDPTSLGAFKSSRIEIGSTLSRIDLTSSALVYAPSANVDIGATPGATTISDDLAIGQSRVFVDSGAVIDVGGLQDVQIPASRNQILIQPVKQNELADDPNYKSSFLNGAGVYVDPRLSGVSSDGVAWIGSPLIDAASYAQQVGVKASELMTTGGNVVLGAASFTPRADVTTAPDVIVKAGAAIDISGGWVTYQAGQVRTTQLVNANGQVVDISRANKNDTYVGIYSGFVASEPRWGVSQAFGDPILLGMHQVAAYSEGRDAGSLTIKSSAVAFDGTLNAGAYAGPMQVVGATPGTAASNLYGDLRALQAARSQLPAGGFLFVQASGADQFGNLTGGADIEISPQAQNQVTSDYGQPISLNDDAYLEVPARDPASRLSTGRLDTIMLSASALSDVGLSQISLQTSGKITIDAGADLSLAAGGVFSALSGRALTIDGSVTAASGSISLTTAELLSTGSVFAPDVPVLGSYDLAINGVLSTRGRWVNDFGAAPGATEGAAYLNGGSINLTAAPRVLATPATASVADTLAGLAQVVNSDISGSILVNTGALLDVSSGGFVAGNGGLNLGAKGGDVSLTEQTTYFQLSADTTVQSGGIAGFRVSDLINSNNGVAYVPVNPDRLNARVSIAPGTILANGFSGGGTFSLTTPAFSFGSDLAQAGTELPLDFFHDAGFASYQITSYGTALVANGFGNGLGGFNALPQTQIVTVGAGQVLNLTRSGFTPLALLTAAQTTSLRNLASGGDLYGVLPTGTPTDAWDQTPVSLSLGGLLELSIAAGGQVVGAPGAGLTVSLLRNDGLIRLPGGALTQSEVLPALYANAGAVAVQSLDQAFSIDTSSGIAEPNPNLLGIKGAGGLVLTNAQLAALPLYISGDLPQAVAMQLDPGSRTDLSGIAISNPRAKVVGQGASAQALDGRVVNGGAIQSLSALNTGKNIIAPPGSPSVVDATTTGVRVSGLVLASDAVIDVSGVSATFERRTDSGAYAPTLTWSNGGALYFGGGVQLKHVSLHAAGGAPQALGGMLTVPNLVLTPTDLPDAQTDTFTPGLLEGAGIGTVVSQGSVRSQGGDVKLELSRAFYLTALPYGNGIAGQDITSAAGRDLLEPVVRADGNLEIDAPYIGFDSSFQTVSTPLSNDPGTSSATFSAQTIDVTGAVLFDRSISTVNLSASGDLRLIGVAPWQQVFNVNGAAEPNSLVGQLAANGDLNITAAQVYPATGSTFYVSSAAANGTISFAAPSGPAAAAPYSAGGSLLVQAANIVQAGVVRAPLGSLTLGSNQSLTILTDNVASDIFAPATTSLTIQGGSVTSVSASGLSIPYGTTTDQTEWFFSPNSSSVLTAPPAAKLTLAGQGVTIAPNAAVDLRGGGDVYAYEFIPGTGGSRDVLSQQNPDAFTSNNGFQYPDGRQVYAIVPGLSSQATAPYDPLYSANYGNLYAAGGVGSSIHLNGGPGVPAGWYTLLPAQYAMLPGGMRVVLDTSVANAAPGAAQTLKDGTVVVPGEFGDPRAGSISSTVSLFDVQSQSTFRQDSNIVLTSGNTAFAADAAHDGVVMPRLPIDAGRLVLNPVNALSIQSTMLTAPASGGRGADVDIAGSIIVVSGQPVSTASNVINLTVPELSLLDASSLFIGGQRTDNADGTTSLDVTTQWLKVSTSPDTPLTAPEVILAVDGPSSTLQISSGASIVATGTQDAGQTGELIIDGSTGPSGHGALVRVANGPERLVTRENLSARPEKGVMTVGAGVTLGGQSVLIDSTGSMSLDPTVTLKAASLAIDAPAMAFTTVQSPGVLTFTGPLVSQLSAANSLTLRSPAPIAFYDGSYSFGDLTLDTPGLARTGGAGTVTLNAGTLELSNSGTAGAACTVCGLATLAINAKEIRFGLGSLDTYGFGRLVSLTATSGVFAVGVGGLNVGSGPLSVQTPFVGDMATPATVGSTTSATAGLTLVSNDAITIRNTAGATVQPVDGTPGSSLTIQGASISVSGAELRATAGALTLAASGGDIDITNGAVLATPGYSKSFGDAADPYSISAPGGLLTVKATNGAINVDAGTTLSVGGGVGAAGALDIAASGAVNLNGTLDAAAPQGLASFSLDSGSAFDLNAFETHWGGQFTGNVSVRTGAGDLSLAQGVDLKALSVSLTADGGTVDIGGKIDVSGVQGGFVSLSGVRGVELESSSTIDAQASGYGLADTRQASGGTVFLGTDIGGAIQVASGAVIDLSALRPADRLIPMSRDGAPDFTYVQGDQGGQLTIRAPIVASGGAESVNVNFAGTIVGASTGAPGSVRSIVLEGFQRFDLAQIASSGAFTGVTKTAPSQITLDTTAHTPGTPNFLTDNAPGTVVDFVRNFNISAASPQLGGLARLPAFHARPGVELSYGGAIVLASNWNLGAGVVDVAGAVAAGLMAPDPQLPGKFYVIPGDEGAVFSRFTRLSYRVGAKVTGEPGDLAIRAGGSLTLDGSITDGFFTFADQSNPDYVATALGGGTRNYQGYLQPSCATGDCSGVGDFDPAVQPANYVYVPIPGVHGMPGAFFDPVPYDAAANRADARGSGPGRSGDAIGSAQLFPLVQSGASSAPANSWTYRLVAGAATSADPTRTAVGSTADLVVQGANPYTLAATPAAASFLPNLDVQVGADILSASDWLAAYLRANPSVSDTSYTLIDFSGAGGANRPALQADALNFAADPANAGQVTLLGPHPNTTPTGMAVPLSLAAKFLSGDPAVPGSLDFSAIAANYAPPRSRLLPSVTAYAPTLIRTGTGDIALAAAGNVDLSNAAYPIYMDASGATVLPRVAGALQLGGIAVYTAGHAVDLSSPLTLAASPISGRAYLDASASGTNTDVFNGSVSYAYGAGSAAPGANGLPGVMLANPTYAQGGGSLTVTAGQDVLGRRDLWLENAVSSDYDTLNGAGYAWIGQGDQPWRSGTVGQLTDIRLDPQLFQEGLGALAGGDIRVSAGRNVSDVSVDNTTSVATAQIETRVGGASTGQALMTFGGGDARVSAANDLLGGRLYVSSGQGSVDVGRDIASAGVIGPTGATIDNTLVVRLSDATIDLQAGGSVELQGVAALGVRGASAQILSNLDATGFYAPKAGVSILADGPVTIDNKGAEVLAPNVAADNDQSIVVYPGSLRAVSLTGDLTVATPDTPGTANYLALYPSLSGQLVLAAAGDISAASIDMEDGDPNQLPGVFTGFKADISGAAGGSRAFLFPGVLSDTSEATLRTYHAATPIHLGGQAPNRIYAGQDILSMVLSTPMQTRIGAGRDIVNMMFFGQNLAAGDITRIVAGRDIVGTTELVAPIVALPNVIGPPLPAVQGNTFVIGGPGSFFLEAGRDLGPFLNSAVTPGFLNNSSAPPQVLTYGGGVMAVGNDWNPGLAPVSASLYTEFGVAKGQDFDALREAYLDPAHLSAMPDYLFQQATSPEGLVTTDRTKPIYAPILVSWMEANESQVLVSQFGTANVSYAQAYQAFASLPELTQRTFLLKYVYFDELKQPSIPGPSFHQYSRGYQAVNNLFPSSLGYTQNDLTGASNGSKAPVHTGDLDLRLATLQTDWGGDIFILGPGGRVLGGSTVRTSQQAQRRAYDGGRLFEGNGPALNFLTPLATNILSIPVGKEGVLTLQGGGIYTFTDRDFLLNQSRLFTEEGGDIVMWSSNGDLNAGQGPKTTPDIPPVQVKIDENAISLVNQDSAVSGAGIGAFQPNPNGPAPSVYLLAPAGTVDAGAAGVRVAGDLYVAANSVANADNFKVGGASFGLPVSNNVNVGAETSANAAAAQAAQVAQSAATASGQSAERSIITVNVEGYAGTECPPDDKTKCKP